MKDEFDNIDEQASDWIAKIDRGLDESEELKFLHWIEKDPLHAQALKELQGPWLELDKLEHWKPQHRLDPDPDFFHNSNSGKRLKNIGLFLGGIAAATLLGLSLQFFWTQLDSSQPAYLLSAGEYAPSYERHVLEDGSVVEMKAGSQVEVLYSDQLRQLVLKEGEALFTVKRDTTRPFQVRANGLVLEALGTAFSVSIEQQMVEVIVTHGRVKVEEHEVLPHAPLQAVKGLEIAAGQKTLISEDAPLEESIIAEASNIEITEQLSWREEVLQFDSTPLEQVVAELNKRNYTRIIIVDRSLGRIRINATLKPQNLDGFLEMLQYSAEVVYEVDQSGDILIRSK